MEKVQPKITFMASANGGHQSETKRFDWHSFALSVASAGVIGCTVFIFKMNERVVKMEEHDLEHSRGMDKIEQTMNQMQLDLRDIRDRTIRIEAQQKQSPLK
jgi:hypothetical protein